MKNFSQSISAVAGRSGERPQGCAASLVEARERVWAERTAVWTGSPSPEERPTEAADCSLDWREPGEVRGMAGVPD